MQDVRPPDQIQSTEKHLQTTVTTAVLSGYSHFTHTRFSCSCWTKDSVLYYIRPKDQEISWFKDGDFRGAAKIPGHPMIPTFARTDIIKDRVFGFNSCKLNRVMGKMWVPWKYGAYFPTLSFSSSLANSFLIDRDTGRCWNCLRSLFWLGILLSLVKPVAMAILKMMLMVQVPALRTSGNYQIGLFVMWWYLPA